MSAAPTTGKPQVQGEAARKLRPRDAATLIIVDRTGPAPRVLMGRRRMEQVFMPGVYVFPGGRVDKTDRLVPSADELTAVETEKLLLQMKGSISAGRARALALAAVRETFEEAGLVIGAPCGDPAPPASAVPGWSEFFALGYRPTLAPLTFFARAITPPGKPRRYDTRFFHMDAGAISHRIENTDGELSGLHWLTVEDARELDLPTITRVVLEDLMDKLQHDVLHATADRIPFYHQSKGSFRRDMLKLERPEP